MHLLLTTLMLFTQPIQLSQVSLMPLSRILFALIWRIQSLLKILQTKQLTMKKLGYLIQGPLTILFIQFHCLLRSLVPYLLLCICLMVKSPCHTHRHSSGHNIFNSWGCNLCSCIFFQSYFSKQINQVFVMLLGFPLKLLFHTGPYLLENDWIR